jgi:DNA-binding response OmpR family regulator
MSVLLLVEDDQAMGSLLSSALTANGHDVTWHRTGVGALEATDERPFDLVLLDLGLPDVDGLDLCRVLKLRQPHCVLVILTARKDEMDVVGGLESGADDYLTKPFRLTELLARVRAHLRRLPLTNDADEVPYESGDLWVDVASRRCRIRGVDVTLRPKEFDLLARLAAEPGRAITREQLMSDVWDENWFGSTKTLDVHMAALRRRLGETARAVGTDRIPTIATLRGHGYRLDESNSPR